MKKIESVWAEITAKNEAYKQKFSKQEKVDLSAVDDMEDARILLQMSFVESENIEDDALRLLDKYDSLFQEGKRIVNFIEQSRKLILNNLKDAELFSKEYARLANEIGIAPKESKQYNDLQSTMAVAERNIERLDDFENKLKRAISL